MDLLIVIATIVVIAGVVLPMMSRPKGKGHQRIRCVNNLKQVSIGFRLYAIDGDPYPSYNMTNQAWNYLQTVGREIGSPKVLLCPEDASRSQPALNFEEVPAENSFSSPAFQNNALSYFYGVDSSEDKPGMILSGDRSLSTNATILSGLLSIETNTPVQWAKGLHPIGGNVGLADGSVSQMNDARLLDLVRTGTNGTQRLLIP